VGPETADNRYTAERVSTLKTSHTQLLWLSGNQTAATNVEKIRWWKSSKLKSKTTKKSAGCIARNTASTTTMILRFPVLHFWVYVLLTWC